MTMSATLSPSSQIAQSIAVQCGSPNDLQRTPHIDLALVGLAIGRPAQPSTSAAGRPIRLISADVLLT